MERFSVIKVVFVTILMFALIILMNSWDLQWDLTSDKRYTLHPIASNLVRVSAEPIVITNYLEGQVPASFRNYEDYVNYYISELRRYNSKVELTYRNPTEGEDSEEFIRFLSSRGVEPIRRQVATKEEVNSNLLYPYLSLHNSKEIVFINLLDSPKPGASEEENLLQAQLSFEGKFLRALRQLTKPTKPEIHVVGFQSRLLTEGLNRSENLSGYRFFSSNAEEMLQRKDSLEAVIAVVKKEDLTRHELLAIDQLSGSSVPVVWLVDKFDVTIDSLRKSGSHLAMAKDYLMEDYLFRCGVKILPELVMDLQSSRIPQVVNDGSSTPQTRMMKYPFHPLIITDLSNPPLARLSAPLSIFYTSPIELLDYPGSVIKKVLIRTSPYTKMIKTPAPLDFRLMQTEADPNEYNTGTQILGVEIEGRILPYFSNRLTVDDRNLLTKYNISFSPDSQYIKQIVLTDVDFALPAPGPNGGVFPIGYNPVERQMYEANTQFIAQILESLIEGDVILNLSDKTSDIAIFDGPRYQNDIWYYRFLLVGLPLLLLIVCYICYHWIRKKVYAS